MAEKCSCCGMEKVVLLLAPGEGLLLCLHCFSKQHPAIAQAMQARLAEVNEEVKRGTMVWT